MLFDLIGYSILLIGVAVAFFTAIAAPGERMVTAVTAVLWTVGWLLPFWGMIGAVVAVAHLTGRA